MTEQIEKSLLEIDFASLTRRKFTPSPAAWEDHVLYFLLLDRFSDGKERDGYRDNADRPVETGTTPVYQPGDSGRVDYGAWLSAGNGWQGGTLAGLKSKLGYLRRLGITTLWVSPIFRQVPCEPSYHGYGIQNFLDVDPHFGSRAEFRDFVQAAHEQGIYVILDIIAHHTGNVFTYDAADVGFLQLVANQVAVAIENAFAFQEITALKDQLSKEKAYLENEVRTEHNFEEIVGRSAVLRRVLKQVETVAPTGSTVLVCGETGTGKELIARALHDLSPRRERTFAKLNCAAIPTGLFESELFGHEKGAFTGAISQKIGRFELAHRGTLFLDEVGEIPPELQLKLLRVLQEQEFERLGSTKTIHVDVRLVAATNRDLAAMVADGRFRSDLYYRLNVFPLLLPPLRERPDDIPPLVRHFTQRFARRIGRRIETIPSAVMEALVGYPWPGNIRELQNVIERAVVLSPGTSLQVPRGDLQPVATQVPAPTAEAVTQAPVPLAAAVTLAEAEREYILGALRETGWTMGGPNGAAARLGMKRSMLCWKMKKLGISRPELRAPAGARARPSRATVDTPSSSRGPSRRVRSASPWRSRLYDAM